MLRQRGLEPGDIDVVINTHLHWDHCSNNALFPKATFYVQRDELGYACAPLPVHRQAYEKNPGLSPGWLDVWGRIRRQVESDVAKAQTDAADVAAAKLSAQITLAEDYFQLRAADVRDA